MMPIIGQWGLTVIAALSWVAVFTEPRQYKEGSYKRFRERMYGLIVAAALTITVALGWLL